LRSPTGIAFALGAWPGRPTALAGSKGWYRASFSSGLASAAAVAALPALVLAALVPLAGAAGVPLALATCLAPEPYFFSQILC